MHRLFQMHLQSVCTNKPIASFSKKYANPRTTLSHWGAIEFWLRVVVDLYCDVQPDIDQPLLCKVPFIERCMSLSVKMESSELRAYPNRAALICHGISTTFCICFVRDWEKSQEEPVLVAEDAYVEWTSGR
jgi:hypothetical protein